MNSPNELSFLPDDYMERKAQRRTNAICATLFMVVAVAIGFAFWVTEKATRAVEQRLVALDRECAEAAKPIQQFQQIQEKERTLTRQAETAASLLEKVPRYLLLAEFTNRLPDEAALSDFTMDAKRRPSANAKGDSAAMTTFEAKKAQIEGKLVTATAAPQGPEPRIYDVTIHVTGVASTDVRVSQYMTKLGQCALLKEVSLVQTELFTPPQSDLKLRRFQIDATLDPKATAQATTQPAQGTAAVELNR
jgi:Tfp pilus assembly protein PilN